MKLSTQAPKSSCVRGRVIASAFVAMLSHYTFVACMLVLAMITAKTGTPITIANWQGILWLAVFILSLLSGPIFFLLRTPRGERTRIVPWLRLVRACAIVVAIPYLMFFYSNVFRPWMSWHSTIREIFPTVATIAFFWLPDLLIHLIGKWKENRRFVLRQNYSPAIAFGVATILFLLLLLISAFILDFTLDALLRSTSWIQRLRLDEEVKICLCIAICVVMAYGGARLAFMRMKWRPVPLDYAFCVSCGYDLRGIVGRCPECGTMIHCGACGYNLNGNTSGTCPECGTIVNRT